MKTSTGRRPNVRCCAPPSLAVLLQLAAVLIVGAIVLAPLDLLAVSVPSISVFPATPMDTDTIKAELAYHCSTPLLVENRSKTVTGNRVDILISMFCGGFDPGADIFEEFEIGVLPAGQYSIHLLLQTHGDPSTPYSPIFEIASNSFEVHQREVKVTEFFHAGLNHYVMTANQVEADQLVAHPEQGWMKTGRTFNAVAAGINAPAPFFSVCRFYGSISPGPNSHFYTLNVDECNFLKQLQLVTPSSQPRWNFESMDFVAGVPGNDGTCAPQIPVAVRRFYNNRALENDSNHRYTTSDSDAQVMRDQGWRDEGIVMCALP